MRATNSYSFKAMIRTGFPNDSLGVTSPSCWSNIPNLTADDLRNFVSKNFVGNKMVLSGSSVAQDRFVKIAEQHFVRSFVMTQLIVLVFIP